jgi:tetrahydromethanopterin S-methyltransferase subunit G
LSNHKVKDYEESVSKIIISIDDILTQTIKLFEVEEKVEFSVAIFRLTKRYISISYDILLGLKIFYSI